MARGNAGQIGSLKTPASGIISLSESQQLSSYSYLIEYLCVGGGGGGAESAGGGGAGGWLAGTSQIVKGKIYSILVGLGGAASTGQGPATNGYETVIENIATSIGGGAGSYLSVAGKSGGSGGGGGVSQAGGSGVSGQGSGGGANSGGGGGAGGSGASNSGIGGVGLASSITGTSVTYAKGGGGNNAATTGSGTANTGNGGGGSTIPGGGGSGVAILKIPTAKYTGIITGSPTVSTSGNFTILKFISSGTYLA
jgi:hypothetical protein